MLRLGKSRQSPLAVPPGHHFYDSVIQVALGRGLGIHDGHVNGKIVF